jgi:isocitrate/isopropylmalate dehydrogenase
VLAGGLRTPDLGGDAGTREVGDRLLAALGAA